MKFVNFARKWLKQRQGEVKDISLSTYQNQINSYMIPFFKEYKVESIDQDAIVEFKKYLESRQLSKCTRGNIIRLLNMMLYPSKDKTNMAEKDIKKEKQYLSQDEVEVLMNYLENNPSRNNMLVMLQLLTGIKLGELCALKGKNIDMKKASITIDSIVNRVNNNAKYKVTKTILQITSITNKRIVYVPQWFMQYLKQLNVNKNAFIVTGNYKPGNARTIQANMSVISKKINIKINSNILQATFIEGALRKGSTLKQIADFVGTTPANLEKRGYEENPNFLGIFKFQESIQP